MFKEDQHAGLIARVGVIDQDCPAAQEVAVAFKRKVDRGVEQRMPWANEVGKGLAGHGDEILLEGDPFVTDHHRRAVPNGPVAVADDGRDIGDLKAFGLPVVSLAAQPLESLAEERGDEVRLEPAGLGPFHVLADCPDLAGVHRIGGQCPFFDQFADLIMVEGFLDNLVQLRPNIGPVAIPHGLQEQFPQWPIVESKLAENIEHLAAQCLAFLVELLQEPKIDFAFARALGDQVPQVANFGLSDTVNAAESLLQAVGVPGQVVIDHQVGALKVDAFAGGVGGDQDFDFLVLGEGVLGLATFLAAHAAVDSDDRLRTSQQSRVRS